VEPVNTREAAEFLGRFPPFDVLPEDERTAVAESVELRTYVDGENILVEDAEPADHLYVVRDGAVELVHQEEVVDVLEPGECFGHPSLLTGMAPAFTVRTREPSDVILVPSKLAGGLAGGGRFDPRSRGGLGAGSHPGLDPPR